jgi:hypothetical protein
MKIWPSALRVFSWPALPKGSVVAWQAAAVIGMRIMLGS